MNKKKKYIIKTDNLHLVDVRFYDQNGVEVLSEKDTAKAIVYEYDGYYYDVITGDKEPFMKRAPYSNVSKYGTHFGSKLTVVNKDLITDEGICYVESFDQDFLDGIKKSSTIDYERLEDMILQSELLFLSRYEIANDRVGKSTRSDKKLCDIMEKDRHRSLYYIERVKKIRRKNIQKVLNLNNCL